MSINEDKIRLFKQLEPPVGLYQSVCLGIDTQKKLQAKRQAVLFAIVSAASLLSLVFFSVSIWSQLAQSNIWQYISLPFTDFQDISVYWSDLLFVLTESLPVMSLAFVLGSVFVFLQSLKSLAKDLSVLQGRWRFNI